MKRLLIVGMLLLSGCATYSALTGTSVSPQTTVVAINTFDALETVATGYLRLPACVKGGPLLCRSVIARARIISSVMSGRVARDQLVLLLQTNQGGSIPVASFDTLQAAIQTLQAVYAQFDIQPRA